MTVLGSKNKGVAIEDGQMMVINNYYTLYAEVTTHAGEIGFWNYINNLGAYLYQPSAQTSYGTIANVTGSGRIFSFCGGRALNLADYYVRVTIDGAAYEFRHVSHRFSGTPVIMWGAPYTYSTYGYGRTYAKFNYKDNVSGDRYPLLDYMNMLSPNLSPNSGVPFYNSLKVEFKCSQAMGSSNVYDARHGVVYTVY